MSAVNTPVPPCSPLEVVFSFDTTGSMYSWLEEIRGRVQDMIQRLQADIPGIRIAVMAHGDYCDAHTYVTKWIDFETNVVKLCDFVKNVERTGGGDAPECYELVLRQVRTELSWTAAGSRRVLVLIGDDNPHQPGDACNKDNIDWRAETKALALAGVTTYGVQCGNNRHADLFYKTISMATMGKHLRLEDFNSLFDVLMAVCYREGNDTAMLASYEKEVRARSGGQGLAVDIDAIFAALRDEAGDGSGTAVIPLLPVTSTATVAPPKPTLTKAPTLILPTSDSPAKAPKKVPSKKRRNLKSPLDKFKQSNLPLLKRENVPEGNFSLHTKKWSPWILALACSDDVPKGQKNQWRKRVGREGLCLRKLAGPTPRGPSGKKAALFEVAVQAPGANKRRHVVFSAFSARGVAAPNWERRLLGASRLQVDKVLQQGCKVFIRFCVVGGQDEVTSARRSLARYDYAWRKVRAVRRWGRGVTKGNVCISRSKSLTVRV